MLLLKKNLLNKKIEKIIADDFFILIYQFHNVKTKQWDSLKYNLSKIEKTQTFLVKNKIVCFLIKNQLKSLKNVFFHEKKTQNLKSLFQGPTFIVASTLSTSSSKFYKIESILNKYTNFIFVGALFQGQFFTHLDFKMMIKLEKNIGFTRLEKNIQSKAQKNCLKPKKHNFLESSLTKLPLLPLFPLQLLHHFMFNSLEYTKKMKQLVDLLLAKQKQLFVSIQLKKTS